MGALAAFRAAIHCKPDYASAHINLAALLLKRGQRDETLAHLHYAAKLNPQDHAPKELLDQLLKQSAAPRGSLQFLCPSCPIAAELGRSS